MVSEEVKRLSVVTTDDFLQAAGFSEEELNLEYLTDTMICLSGIAYAMRLIYPIEGPKAIERHFQDGYELVQEALAVIEFSKKPAEYLTLNVVRGFIVENLLRIQPDIPKEKEEEFLAKYRIERRVENLPRLIRTALTFIYLGRLCGLELGKRLAQNMHAVEAIQLRDGIEDVKIKGTLHFLKTLPSGLLIPQKVEVTTGEELKNQCLESLMDKLSHSASRVKLLWDGEHMRKDLIHRLLVEEVTPKLMNQWSFRRTINEALNGDLARLPKRAKSRIKNVRKDQQREVKRFESYDRTVETATGEAMTGLEILEAEGRAKDTPCMEIDEGFTQDQLNALEKLFRGKKQKREAGQRRLRIFLYRYHDPEACRHGGQKRISEMLDIPHTTVNDDLRFIEQHADEIKKIMSR